MAKAGIELSVQISGKYKIRNIINILFYKTGFKKFFLVELS